MRPQFRVTSNGNDITAAISDRLLQLRVTDQAGQKSDTCEITVDDRGQEMALPQVGTRLEVSMGYEDLVRMGTYVVDEVSMSYPPAIVKVRAKAMSMAPQYKTPKTRSWDNQTIGQIVATIAAEHGLTPRVGSEYVNVLIEHIDQTEESDAHFLTRLAQQHGAVAKPIEGNLVFVPEGQGGTAGGRTLQTITINAEDCKSYSATIKDRGNYTQVSAKYLDKETGREVTIIEPVAGSERFWGGAGDTFRDRKLYPTEEEARAAAIARGDQLAKGQIQVKVQMGGAPWVFAEHPLQLVGFNTAVTADLIVHSVSHEYGSRGFITSIDAGNIKANNQGN